MLLDRGDERHGDVPRRAREGGRCISSSKLVDVFVERQAPVNLQASLTAPPQDVATVDVVVPNVKTFTDVPLAR
jgi:hypothetical protein